MNLKNVLTKAGCTEDARVCPDGSAVVRDPNNDCEFPECPEANAAVCTTDVQICDDGTAVSRNPDNECQFNECPDISMTELKIISDCEYYEGLWTEFGNSCVDSCELARDPSLSCAQMITEGCDCGPNKCWDAETNSCVTN